MKKLTLVTLISSALSAGAMAGDYKDKISHSFNDLDADGNGYISETEAKDGKLTQHWETMNTDGDDVISSEEFYTHIANNLSHYTDSLVASAKVEMNGMDDVDPKTVSSAGDDELAMDEDASYEQSSSMTVKAEGDNMKDVDKEYSYEEDVDVDVDADSDELAMDDDDVEADIEQESTMTVKSEEENMGGEQNITVEKDVDVEMEGEAAAIAATEFDDIDTDADGKLTKAEIAEAAEKVQFHEIDINNDEMVSRAEFDSYKRTTVTTEEKEYDDDY